LIKNRQSVFVLYYGVGLAPRGATSHVYEELEDMGKSQPKRQAHHAAKAAGKKKRKVDWTRIALIVIGIMIVISMVLSMVQF
jgi:hypothetical protein